MFLGAELGLVNVFCDGLQVCLPPKRAEVLCPVGLYLRNGGT